MYTDDKSVLDPLGIVMRGGNELYRVEYGGMQILWVLPVE